MATQTRLECAFDELTELHDILAVHDCECCSTCAHARLSGELLQRPELRGYVFYHGQDVETCISDRELYIRFAAQGVTPAEAAAVAQTAVTVLRSWGLEVEWNGDSGRCILVTIPEEDMHFFDSLRPEAEEEEGGEEWDEDEEEDLAEGQEEWAEGEQQQGQGGGAGEESDGEPAELDAAERQHGFVLFQPLFSRPAGLAQLLQQQQRRRQQQQHQQLQQRKNQGQPHRQLARPYASQAYELA